jgi:regulator of RNase E activity RraA
MSRLIIIEDIRDRLAIKGGPDEKRAREHLYDDVSALLAVAQEQEAEIAEQAKKIEALEEECSDYEYTIKKIREALDE